MAARNLAQFAEFGKKIIGIGRNYANHAKELGNAIPEKPMFFLKPTTSYVASPGPIVIPYPSAEIHHEVELGVVISKLARSVPRESAMDYVGGYALALDMTCRDAQAKAKKEGAPWSEAKGYDTFCPIGSYIEKSLIANPHDLTLRLRINGEIRQQGSTSDMIFPIDQLIAYVSTIMTLEPGDIILTGLGLLPFSFLFFLFFLWAMVSPLADLFFFFLG